jgi:hypothetical protein
MRSASKRIVEGSPQPFERPLHSVVEDFIQLVGQRAIVEQIQHQAARQRPQAILAALYYSVYYSVCYSIYLLAVVQKYEY